MHGDLALSSTISIVKASMAGGTEAKEDGVRVANIMVAMGGMEVHAVSLPCSVGIPHSPMFDMAKLASPACPFLALPG